MRENKFTHPIYIHKSYWADESEEWKKEFAQWVFDYYRNDRGFPYYEYTIDEKKKEYDKLIKYDYKKILEEDRVKQVMTGLGLAWSYFPHAWSVRCHKYKTPFEVFYDDELFMKAIWKGRLQRGGFITDAGMRKSLRSTGNQAVSNFRPTAAGCIYEHFAGNGVVWDMSCGFGGRLLGFLTSERGKVYIGVDPSSDTYNGLEKMEQDFFALYDSNKTVELHKVGSEDFLPERYSLDLAFTSPPYFNTEKYSDEKTQSYIKFSEKEQWLEEFLGQTIKNCIFGLKPNGYLIINIANVPTYKNLCEDFENLMKRLDKFFEPMPKLNYILSNAAKGGYKSEPIYVYRRK